MSAARSILRWQVRALARTRWVQAYAVVLFLLTEGRFRLSGGGDRVVVSLLNVVLLLVPMVSLVVGVMHLQGAREFIELLLAQPVGRRTLFRGLYLGFVLPLAGAFALGTGLPFVLRLGQEGAGAASAVALLGTGVLLTAVFGALAFLVATAVPDRTRAFGVALLVWLGATLLYDGAVLLVTVTLARWPLERPLLGLMLLNPVDLGRVLVLLRLDAAALLGYTGAVFARTLNGPVGTAAALGALTAWMLVPYLVARRAFRRRDF